MQKRRRLQFPPKVINLLCSDFQNQEKVHNNIDDENESEYREGTINLALEYENLLDNLELENE